MFILKPGLIWIRKLGVEEVVNDSGIEGGEDVGDTVSS